MARFEFLRPDGDTFNKHVGRYAKVIDKRSSLHGSIGLIEAYDKSADRPFKVTFEHFSRYYHRKHLSIYGKDPNTGTV